MARKHTYEVGDYVKYEGNLSTLSKILRDPDFGKIEEFGNQHDNVERIYLYLLGKKQHIWCDFRDIRPINTEPEHFKALNFQTIDVNGRKKYEMGTVIISGAIIQTPGARYILPNCVGDFTKGIPDIDSYFKGGELDLELFSNHYPDVNNLNELFTFLENQGFDIDKEKVVCS